MKFATLIYVVRGLSERALRFPSSIEQYAADTRVLERALSAVPLIYFLLLYIAFNATSQWLRAPQYAAEHFDPIWPLLWLSSFPYETIVGIVSGMFLCGALLGAVFFSHRLGRLAAFLGFWQYHALLSSFGSPDHTMIVWFYPLLFLVFLPDIWRRGDADIGARKMFLMAFFGAQVYTGVVYFLAGVGKMWGGIGGLIAGGNSFLAHDALALHIAYWLDSTNSTSALGSFIVANPILGWPLFLGMLYLQLFALLAVFRPSLHRLWGAALITLHLTIFLTMDILFVNSILLLAALFLNSPFEAAGMSWRERVRDLPLFGLTLRRII